MRKMLVIASREYQAAVHTKTFLIGLLIMPILMGGSILVQWLVHDIVDTQEKTFALVNRTARADLVNDLRQRIDHYNDKLTRDPTSNQQIKPRFVIQVVPASLDTLKAKAQQRFDLSEQVRQGKLVGFLEILEADKKEEGALVTLHYQTNRPTFTDFTHLARDSVNEYLRLTISKEAGLSETQMKSLLHPVIMKSRGLAKRSPQTGEIEGEPDESQFAGLIVSGGLMMLMFMVVLMGATPLMQSVVEEKMQRIAEVLLGSVRPFELMMGKLVGMAGVSLTIVIVYLGGAYASAAHYGYASYIPMDVVVWFLVFQTLAALMFGSLFIAIGAACTDMKETQNLLWPVMLLACMPVFLMGNVLREPNGPVARGFSFFPFATPTLMIARQAVPPGIPWWEPVVGVILVLATTIACVYAAGRIFRVGILMQGKGARIGEMVKWLFRG